MGGLLDWGVPALMLAVAAAVTLWMAGAIYYDVCGGARWGRWLAAGWVVGVVVLFAALAAALAAVRRSARRRWRCSSAGGSGRSRATTATGSRAWPCCRGPCRDGDAVTIENVRNFEYRSLDDFTPRYETRTYHLANLKGVDIIFFNWGSPLMSHPVLVFDFGPDGRVCMSIEVRYRKGQTVLDPPQPVPAAGVDLPRRRRARRHPPPDEVRPAAGGAPVPLRRDAPRSCGPRSSITSGRSTACTRRRAGTTACARTAPPRSTGCRTAGAARLAGARQRPAGPGPLRGRPAGPHVALPGTPADRVSQRRREQRPRGRVRGPHPPRTGKAPP